MTQYTQGPWEIDDNCGYKDAHNIAIFCRIKGEQIATVHELEGPFEDCEAEEAQRYANAKLIAEAGTVCNELNMTPRQIADSRAAYISKTVELIALNTKLLAALEGLLPFMSLEEGSSENYYEEKNEAEKLAQAAIAAAKGE